MYKDVLTVVIDGMVVQNVKSIELTHDDAVLIPDRFNRPSNVLATIEMDNGTKLKFLVEAKDQQDKTVYFYGPMRHMFPQLFEAIDPTPWQVAYLKHLGRDSLDRFRLQRTDQLFKTREADLFRLGFEAGQAHGSETERKLAKIAKDGLKGKL